MCCNRRIFFFLCIAFFSCQKQQKWEDVLKSADSKLLYYNNTEHWELVRAEANTWDDQFTIKKIDGDTVKIMMFLQRKDKSLSIYTYKKRFPCGVDTCYLEMSSQDTLFLYKKNNTNKVFQVGEYAYRFTTMRMDSIELDYYLKHEDSLRTIRGNNLPPLPRK